MKRMDFLAFWLVAFVSRSLRQAICVSSRLPASRPGRWWPKLHLATCLDSPGQLSVTETGRTRCASDALMQDDQLPIVLVVDRIDGSTEPRSPVGRDSRGRRRRL